MIMVVVFAGWCPVAPQRFLEIWWGKWMKVCTFVEVVVGVLVGWVKVTLKLVEMIFWLFRRFCNLEGAFTFQCDSEWCGGWWSRGCWVGGPWSYSFGGCFCLELGSVDEWTSGGVVSTIDVTCSFSRSDGVGDISWVKCQRSIFCIFL